MKEVIRVLLDEVIVYRIEVVLSIFKTEIRYFLSLLIDTSFFIFDQMQNFDRIISVIIFFTLYDCNGGLVRDHANHDGSLNTQKDVISCDYLSVNVAFGKSTDG